MLFSVGLLCFSTSARVKTLLCSRNTGPVSFCKSDSRNRIFVASFLYNNKPSSNFMHECYFSSLTGRPEMSEYFFAGLKLGGALIALSASWVWGSGLLLDWTVWFSVIWKWKVAKNFQQLFWKKVEVNFITSRRNFLYLIYLEISSRKKLYNGLLRMARAVLVLVPELVSGISKCVFSQNYWLVEIFVERMDF